MDTVTVIVGCHRCDTRGNCTFTTPKASENQAAACDLMMIMLWDVQPDVHLNCLSNSPAGFVAEMILIWRKNYLFDAFKFPQSLY